MKYQFRSSLLITLSKNLNTDLFDTFDNLDNKNIDFDNDNDKLAL